MEVYEMTKQMIGAILLMIVLAISVPMFVRTFIWKRFLKHMNANEDEKALGILESWYYRICFGGYNQKWNLLRFYISRNNTEKAKECVYGLLRDKLSKEQSYQVFTNAFFYFTTIHDQEMSAKLLSRLDDITEDDNREYFHMFYRIMIENKSEDIKTVKKMIEDKEKEKDSPSREKQLGMLQYLLGIQYYNAKDEKEAEKWLRKALNHVKDSPLEKEIKKIIH